MDWYWLVMVFVTMKLCHMPSLRQCCNMYVKITLIQPKKHIVYRRFGFTLEAFIKTDFRCQNVNKRYVFFGCIKNNLI